MESYQYKNYNPGKLILAGAEFGEEKGTYKITYRFDVKTDEMPKNVTSIEMTATVTESAWNVENTTMTEIFQ